MVSNGSTLPCKGKCRSACISIGDYSLHTSMFSFPLGGCDVVLGTPWLCTLGPILWDFAELWMHFLVNGKKHTLKGLQPGSLSIISSHRMENILKMSSHGVNAQLHFIHMQPSTVSTTPLDLQQILDRYACVFAEPVGLPPSDSSVDVYVTSECILLCILYIVTRCLFWDVSIVNTCI